MGSVAAALAVLAAPLAAFSGTSSEPGPATAGIGWPSAPTPVVLMVVGTVLVGLVIGRRLTNERRTASDS